MRKACMEQRRTNVVNTDDLAVKCCCSAASWQTLQRSWRTIEAFQPEPRRPRTTILRTSPQH